MEHFYTLQGEGFNAGKAAYFLRIGGCDVGCVWCDVKESWDASKHPQISVQQMTSWVRESGAKNVVITGGEPAMVDCTPMTTALHAMGVSVWIETSGCYPYKEILIGYAFLLKNSKNRWIRNWPKPMN